MIRSPSQVGMVWALGAWAYDLGYRISIWTGRLNSGFRGVGELQKNIEPHAKQATVGTLNPPTTPLYPPQNP